VSAAGLPEPPEGSPAAALPAGGKHLGRELDALGKEFHRRLAADRPATTRCPACARSEFPPRLRCRRCGTEQEWEDLPRRGRLYAFTTQETALRFAAPTVLALVDVADVRLPCLLEEPIAQLRIGQEVALAGRPEPESGLAVLVARPV
jgi:uncharacterized OB-fold protein